MSIRSQWNRFPEVAVLTVTATGGGSQAGVANRQRPVPADRQAQALQGLAAKTSLPYLLLCRAGQPPDEGWVQAAYQAMQGSALVACVGTGVGRDRAGPTLVPDAGPMLLRRRAYVESGGLSAAHQGVGDGPDLAWRLWAMGYTVLSLPAESRAAEPPSSIYRVYSNWVWTLARDCEDGALDWALERALVTMLALAGKKVAATDVAEPPLAAPPTQRSYIQEKNTLRPRASDLTAPSHRVSRGVGEALAAFHDMVMMLLPQAFARRPAVQSLRRRSDGEIGAAAGEEPVQAIEGYYLHLSCQALGLDAEAGAAARPAWNEGWR